MSKSLEPHDPERELMQRALDGELAPGERESLLALTAENPLLRREWESLERTIRAVEAGERFPAPPFFTADVMKKLPEPNKQLPLAEIVNYLVRARTLRWNLATALSALLIFGLAFAVWNGLKTTREHAPVPGRTTMVTMRLYAPDAREVAVAGTFNKWRSDANRLSREENGYWTISIPLEPGEYAYLFVIDGKAWIADPDAELFRDDGFGSRNAVVRVRT